MHIRITQNSPEGFCLLSLHTLAYESLTQRFQAVLSLSWRSCVCLVFHRSVTRMWQQSKSNFHTMIRR